MYQGLILYKNRRIFYSKILLRVYQAFCIFLSKFLFSKSFNLTGSVLIVDICQRLNFPSILSLPSFDTFYNQFANFVIISNTETSFIPRFTIFTNFTQTFNVSMLCPTCFCFLSEHLSCWNFQYCSIIFVSIYSTNDY